jgi:hypothetical protein
MTVIKIKSPDSRNIVIEKEDKEIGSIKFDGFFRNDITITASDNSQYDFVRRRFWSFNFELRQGNEVFLSTKFMLLGKTIIENAKNGTRYYLKLKSILKDKYELNDENGEKLLSFSIKRGFLIEIKEGIFETTDRFDLNKEHFLVCCAALLAIKQRAQN